MPTVFNAANEVAVELFMKKKIKFLDIYRIIEEAMDNHNLISLDTDEALSIIKEVDKETRKKTGSTSQSYSYSGKFSSKQLDELGL